VMGGYGGNSSDSELVVSMYIKDKVRLGLAILLVQQALLSCYGDKCSLKPVKHSLKWTPELESLRREVRRFYNKCRSDRPPQSWELYSDAQRR
jgi:hypothetical protein